MTEDELKAIEEQAESNGDLTFTVAALVAEVRRLRDAFDTYGNHDQECAALGGHGGRCTCGYTKARNQLGVWL